MDLHELDHQEKLVFNQIILEVHTRLLDSETLLAAEQKQIGSKAVY